MRGSGSFAQSQQGYSEGRCLMRLVEKSVQRGRDARGVAATRRSRAEQRLEKGVAVDVAQVEQVGAAVDGLLRPVVRVRVEVRGLLF